MTKEYLEAIASEYRDELDDYLGYNEDKNSIVGMCRTASKELAARLENAGYPAIAVFIQYMDVPDDFPGRMKEIFGREALNDFKNDEFDGTWPHWVVLCGEFIVDVTSDQFDVSDCNKRVVVTDVDNPSYSISNWSNISLKMT